MEFGLRLDQPDVTKSSASRRLAFGPAGMPAFGILNGRGTTFEGGTDEPDLSLKWLAEGAADYRSEERSYRLSGSAQLLLNRGQPYRMRMRSPSESFVLFFPKKAADAAWQALVGHAEPFPEVPTLAAASPVSLQARLAALRGECRRAVPRGEKLDEWCCAVLNEVAKLAQQRRERAARLPVLRKTTREELLRRLARAESYFEDLGAKATLAGAARAAALSPFHLIRLFDAVYGDTPLAYATAIRLERAHGRLTATGAPIAEIASTAGYASRTAFDRAFARRFGATPGAVRASAR